MPKVAVEIPRMSDFLHNDCPSYDYRDAFVNNRAGLLFRVNMDDIVGSQIKSIREKYLTRVQWPCYAAPHVSNEGCVWVIRSSLSVMRVVVTGPHGLYVNVHPATSLVVSRSSRENCNSVLLYILERELTFEANPHRALETIRARDELLRICETRDDIPISHVVTRYDIPYHLRKIRQAASELLSEQDINELLHPPTKQGDDRSILRNFRRVVV